MNFLTKYSTILLCFFFCLPVALSCAQSEPNLSARITSVDPGLGATLAANERLYLKVSYESNVSLRLQASARRLGGELEFGLKTSPASLHADGKHDALVWLSFSNPTRIEEVVVELLDIEWKKISQIGINMDTTWTSIPAEQPRELAAWIEPLIRKERLKREMVFDPSPQKKETIFDIFFLIAVLTIPIFLFLQVQFLRHFRGRWRELAAIPIISILPMVVVSLFGFGMEFSYWIVFIFRGMPLALIYLVILWVAKRNSEKKESASL